MIIHQCWKENDSTYDHVFEHNRKFGEHKLWNDNSMEEFIKHNFDSKIYKAYKRINPKFGAARTDLFRYCVLYVQGGLYLDAKSTIVSNLSELPSSEYPLLVTWYWDGYWKEYLGDPKGEFTQWCIYVTKPKHFILKLLIDTVVQKIEDFDPTRTNYNTFTHYEAETETKFAVLTTTGPLVFHQVLSRFKDQSVSIRNNLISKYNYPDIENPNHYSKLKVQDFIGPNEDCDS